MNTVKRRLIFTLLLSGQDFMLSRNFVLQKVGNLTWLEKNYNFANTAFSIDELILLNVTRTDSSIDQFCEMLKSVVKDVFVPIAAGGGIRSLEDAKMLLKSGADKLVVNTPLFKNPDMVKELIYNFGSQCVVASLDYKGVGEDARVMINNGSEAIKMSIRDVVKHVESLGVGEIYLNSVQQDGTGQGYDMKTTTLVADMITTPLIVAGGAGNFNHFYEGLNVINIDAVATANLFNFMGDGLADARQELLAKEMRLARW